MRKMAKGSLKPKKSVVKRFKVTGTGKLKIRKQSSRSHLMAHKTSKRKRQLKRQPVYQSAHAYKMKRLMAI
jgi:large subunit ribosomal protein L35